MDPDSDEHDSIDSVTSDRPTMRGLGQHMPSRRGILAGTGLALGAGILGVGGSALAQEEDDEDDDGEVPDQYSQPYTDADVLSYALTLERLEDAFYTQGLETFSEEDVADSSALEQYSEDMTGVVWEYLNTIGSHESTHVDQLVDVLDALGADPGEAPEFTFDFETFDEFLATARTLENTGVAAYAGAAPAIESPDILSAALSIHSVEARHAAFLNSLTGSSPFPNAFDEAMSIPEVLEAIQPFLAGDDDGTETPEEEDETDTPEEETDTPEEGTDTPSDGTETPEGTETLEGTETPGEPTDTPDGTGTPNGTGTPGEGTPGEPTDAPGTPTDTPMNGTDTPGNGGS